MSNLAHIVYNNVDRFPEAPAILGSQTRVATYQELGTAISRAAAGLCERGIRPDDRVAYQLTNGSAATILYFAILSVGAIAVPINPLLSPREVSTIRERTKPAGFFGEVAEANPDILLAGPEDIAGLPKANGARNIVSRGGGEAAVVFFTSGTTGTPKGVILTHDNLRTNAEWVCKESLDGPEWGPGHVNAAVLPLSHSFAMTCSQNATLLGGGALTYVSRFNAPDVLRQISEVGVTTMAMVPSAARALVDAWRASPVELQLRYCLIGGAPIPDDLISEIESSWGAEVLEGYGLTETSPVCAFRTPGVPRKAGSVGRAAGRAHLSVLGESGQPEAEGEGELLVAGPGVTPGYYTPGHLSPGSGPDSASCGPAGSPDWFPTGDIVRIDRDGDVFVLDRKKDIIIHNGYNVYPTEIEAVIRESDTVADAAVVGLPDPESGEAIIAFVVPAGEHKGFEALSLHCRTALARYKQPRDFRAVDCIPRGSKGQVLRDELRSAILT